MLKTTKIAGGIAVPPAPAFRWQEPHATSQVTDNRPYRVAMAAATGRIEGSAVLNPSAFCKALPISPPSGLNVREQDISVYAHSESPPTQLWCHKMNYWWCGEESSLHIGNANPALALLQSPKLTQMCQVS
jgi:hypothetical protein